MQKIISVFLISCFVMLGLGSCSSSKMAVRQVEENLDSAILNTAKSQLGKKYRYGATGPRSFDCSGFVFYVFQQHQIDVGRTTMQQAQSGKRVKVSNAEPGDLVFFGKGRKMQHVGLVLTNRGNSLKVIHSSTSSGVIIEDVYSSQYWSQRIKFAVRVIPQTGNSKGQVANF